MDTEKALAELEELEAQARKAALPPLELEPQTEEKVDFDTFCKSDFRAVKVKDCQAVKKSNKLLRFTLDDGTGTDRQILSGIAQFYKPEELIGKTLMAIVNLPPRKMMGLESNGMLISAVHTERGEERLHLLMLADKIPAGAKMCWRALILRHLRSPQGPVLSPPAPLFFNKRVDIFKEPWYYLSRVERIASA